MLQSRENWIVEEDECIYGEYGDMIDKKPSLKSILYTGSNGLEV